MTVLVKFLLQPTVFSWGMCKVFYFLVLLLWRYLALCTAFYGLLILCFYCGFAVDPGKTSDHHVEANEAPDKEQRIKCAGAAL